MNAFPVIYSWAICAAMDPENVFRWEDRIGKHLQKLVDMGYMDSAAQELTNTYVADIMG